MKTDIQIARETALNSIQHIAQTIDLDQEALIPYGKFMGKVPLQALHPERASHSNLILVTSITPTKAGIGKTTVSIGLALGLNKIGKKAIVALREPSLGPCFGMKGGAAGGGYAQVLPMENINLHFTGDFHAITAAHNTITALLDNYQYQNRATDAVLKEIIWKRVLDVNDRSLRNIVTGLGGSANGVAQESGFDITPASEIMAILCLSQSVEDLKERLERIVLGYKADGTIFTVKDLGVSGAITVLLKDALLPNLVQTTENTAAFIHGGPFANIAHGCNSILATKMAMSYGDYVITEAGFGADLGAEKFFNIKCRKAGISPKLTVVVATAQGLKMHGGIAIEDIKNPSVQGMRKGLENLEKHIENIRSFGQNIVVAFNKYSTDTEEEIRVIEDYCKDQNIGFAINKAFSEGGEGAITLAEVVTKAISESPSKPLTFTYQDSDSIAVKFEKVAQKIYGAKTVSFGPLATKKLKQLESSDMTEFPICIAKTQYSFSTDQLAYGVAKDFDLHIRDLVFNRGAGFIVGVAGEIMRMPGLPKIPQANHIDLIDGQVEGLS